MQPASPVLHCIPMKLARALLIAITTWFSKGLLCLSFPRTLPPVVIQHEERPLWFNTSTGRSTAKTLAIHPSAYTSPALLPDYRRQPLKRALDKQCEEPAVTLAVAGVVDDFVVERLLLLMCLG
jgi:hypothetical protein